MREREREREQIFFEVAKTLLRGDSLGWSDGRIANEADVEIDIPVLVRRRLQTDPELLKMVRGVSA